MGAGAPRRAIGFAGQKDKYAVARQWLSVPTEHAPALEFLEDVDGITVLETSLHRNKLGLGHLRGNRFSLRVRNPRDDWQPIADAVLAHLRQVGAPNYFGPQRFGTFNTNIADGLRLIRGERMRIERRMRRFYQSALQSHLFNWLLKLRMENGLYAAVLTGDRAQRHDSGGMFVVDDARPLNRKASAAPGDKRGAAAVRQEGAYQRRGRGRAGRAGTVGVRLGVRAVSAHTGGTAHQPNTAGRRHADTCRRRLHRRVHAAERRVCDKRDARIDEELKHCFVQRDAEAGPVRRRYVAINGGRLINPQHIALVSDVVRVILREVGAG